MVKKEYKFIIVLLVVIGIFFYQFFFLGKIPFPGDLLVSQYNPWHSYSFLGYAPGGMPNKGQYFDVLRQLYPWRQLAIESFKHFSVPLWNPYNFSGTPLLANDQSAVLYPFNIFYVLFPHQVAWAVLILLQPLLASVGTYFFARKIGIGKWGSLFSGIAYGFCLFQSVFLEYNTIGHTISYLPWALLGIELLLRKKTMLGSILFVLSLVCSFFGGHIQIWGFLILFVFIYTVYRLTTLKKKMVFGLTMGVLVLIVLAAIGIQLLPTLELIGQAARVPQNYTFLVNNLLLQPYQLIVLLIPDIFGNPATRNYLFADSYPGNAIYIGVLPLLFACYALANIKKEKNIFFFTLVSIALFFFLVRSPFTEIFYTLQIPFFSTGSPSNALFLISFCLSLLAGFGLEYFLTAKRSKAYFTGIVFLIGISCIIFLSKKFHLEINIKNTLFTFLLLFIGTFIVGISSFFQKRKILVLLAIFVLTVFDLWYFFQKFNPFVASSLLYPPVSIMHTIEKFDSESRVWSYGEARVEPNVWSIYHIKDADGYDPLYPKQYGEFISSSADGVVHTVFTNQSRSDAVIAPAFRQDDLGKNPYRFKVLDATSVLYILSKEMLPPEFLTMHNWKLKTSQEGWYVYQNLSALPPVYLVDSSDRYINTTDFSQKFYSDSFNLHNSVLLEKNSSNLSKQVGSVSLQSYSPEKVVIQTATDGKNLLVLTDTYFPGWKAFIDDKETPILRANFTFRAVEVPKGVHTVIFSYQPLSFSIGLTLTIMGVGGLLLFLVFLKKTELSYE